MKTSLKPVLERLEAVFDAFNVRFFNGKLDRPVIAIIPNKGGNAAKANGWVREKAWKVADSGSAAGAEEVNAHELDICADVLKRPFYDVCETVLHEMIHIFCTQNGVKDTSRNGNYHNKKFKAATEERGLAVTDSVKYGWAHTKFAPETAKWVSETYPDAAEFTLCRLSDVGAKSKKAVSYKYVCTSCGAIARATKVINITCTDCDIEMVVEN